jgi:threonine aldolase
MSNVIDLRSDTVSKPSAALRAAMAEAEVGDDVFGEDPTLNRLEAMAAERLGKEAALFVASGTMANLVAVMTHCRPGDEVLLGKESHIVNYEVAGAARIGNVLVNPLPNSETGAIDPGLIGANVREANIHAPVTSLLCIENTHNRCGGAAIDLETMAAMTATARTRGLRVHMDGARLFNAAVALETSAAELAADCDSVSFCLSKGLGCPVGSLLCGPKDFISEARRNRKMLGGGMRQAGVLAAAGIYALEHHVARLAEDHANARLLAEGLGKHEHFQVAMPQTNIVLVDIVKGTLGEWLGAFRKQGVLAVALGPSRMRMVTHIDVNTTEIQDAITRIDRAVEAVTV